VTADGSLLFPRVRFTTHVPLDGTRIGLTIWVGSIPRGWVGKQVNPFKWNRTWRITGVPQ
jgi:hypothetical protein